jgi:hypothetical protein
MKILVTFADGSTLFRDSDHTTCCETGVANAAFHNQQVINHICELADECYAIEQAVVPQLISHLVRTLEPLRNESALKLASVIYPILKDEARTSKLATKIVRCRRANPGFGLEDAIVACLA